MDSGTEKYRPRFFVSTLLWVLACSACFLGGWTLPPPDFEQNKTEPCLGRIVRVLNNTAAISLGIDDGVSPGQSVVISRDGKHITAGVIINSKSDISACRVTGTEIMEEGDVATVLTNSIP